MIPSNENLSWEQKQKRDKENYERDQKRRVKAAYIRGALRGIYCNLVISMLQSPKYENLESEQLCRKALDIAKWMQAVWLEDNPEDSPENVDDLQIHTGIGGM